MKQEANLYQYMGKELCWLNLLTTRGKDKNRLHMICLSILAAKFNCFWIWRPSSLPKNNHKLNQKEKRSDAIENQQPWQKLYALHQSLLPSLHILYRSCSPILNEEQNDQFMNLKCSNFKLFKKKMRITLGNHSRLKSLAFHISSKIYINYRCYQANPK